MLTQTIAQDWFARPATAVAPELIGCCLVRQFPDGTIQRGIIVEAEAYELGDPACHAYRRQTPRNAAMFGPAGQTYVYLIYGIYHCVNIVTELEGVPSAVLLRALDLQGVVEPSLSLKAIQRLAAGPGKLCRYLNIDRSLNQTALIAGQPLWVEHRSAEFMSAVDAQQIELVQTTRIGLSQGTDLPWRWYLKGSPAVSKL
jgi:DNA-3-methyladenine glycosylase